MVHGGLASDAREQPRLMSTAFVIMKRVAGCDCMATCRFEIKVEFWTQILYFRRYSTNGTVCIPHFWIILSHFPTSVILHWHTQYYCVCQCSITLVGKCVPFVHVREKLGASGNPFLFNMLY